MKAVPISSLQNPKVKEVIHLRDRRSRDKSQKFVIEGYRELLRALDAGWKVEALFTCPDLFLGSNEKALIDRAGASGACIYQCSPTVFHKISYRDRPDGLVAVAPQRHLDLIHCQTLIKKNPYPLFVVAEGIEKPGNLGTILRSSDAVGVDAVFVCDQCTDVFNPNVVRASVGTLFALPVVEVEGDSLFHWLKENEVIIVAATPGADVEFTQVDMKRSVAIAVGTEQYGLSAKWLDGADIKVRIPMKGVADSLNVAMATTLLMYEALRQRS